MCRDCIGYILLSGANACYRRDKSDWLKLLRKYMIMCRNSYFDLMDDGNERQDTASLGPSSIATHVMEVTPHPWLWESTSSNTRPFTIHLADDSYHCRVIVRVLLPLYGGHFLLISLHLWARPYYVATFENLESEGYQWSEKWGPLRLIALLRLRSIILPH